MNVKFGSGKDMSDSDKIITETRVKQWCILNTSLLVLFLNNLDEFLGG